MVPENLGDGQSINAILFISDEGAFSQYKNIFIANSVKQPAPSHPVVSYETLSLLELANFFLPLGISPSRC
jgi:hypothetical protein